ncbi:MAG: S8 family peptidase [Bacteroidota bacterium]
MKRVLFFLLFLGGALVAIGQETAPSFINGQLFVKLRSFSPLELEEYQLGDRLPDFAEAPELRTLFRTHAVQSLHKQFRLLHPELQRIYRIAHAPSTTVGDLIGALEALPYVEYAERIPIYRSHYTPDDLDILQWHLPMIRAEQAWDYSTGSTEVLVAIVDDAVRLTHEDLAPRIWTNPGEIPGDSIDNDGNGYIDDVNGFDLADQDNDPNPPSTANNNRFSHGTHVAGIAAAATDNNTGIASIGFNVRILPVKTKEDTSLSTNALQATYGGIEYAIATGAQIVNMSFGSTYYNGTLDYLIRAGVDSGMVFVASAGNTGQFTAFYPANYADVISVASTNAFDEKSGFSTYHANIDVSAPGSGILSCTAGSNSSYGFKSGTSMSAPLVAGLIGLMRSVDSLMSPLDLRRCLKNSADNIDPQNPNYVGWLGTGRINAQNAMACMLPLAQEPSGVGAALQVHPVYTDATRTRLDLAAAVPFPGALQIELRDLHGRHLAVPFSGMVNGGEFQFQWEITRGFASGIYLLVWNHEGQQQVQKIRF